METKLRRLDKQGLSLNCPVSVSCAECVPRSVSELLTFRSVSKSGKGVVLVQDLKSTGEQNTPH